VDSVCVDGSDCTDAVMHSLAASRLERGWRCQTRCTSRATLRSDVIHLALATANKKVQNWVEDLETEEPKLAAGVAAKTGQNRP
jgi:hypothetical protein